MPRHNRLIPNRRWWNVYSHVCRWRERLSCRLHGCLCTRYVQRTTCTKNDSPYTAYNCTRTNHTNRAIQTYKHTRKKRPSPSEPESNLPPRVKIAPILPIPISFLRLRSPKFSPYLLFLSFSLRQSFSSHKIQLKRLGSAVRSQ